MDYQNFLAAKAKTQESSGFEISDSEINQKLFPFQKHIVKKALSKGKYAIFADCGLGKTPMQLEYAYQVTRHTGKDVLILAPLAVSGQTIQEGIKFGIDVKKYDESEACLPFGGPSIWITNYEQLEKIDTSLFSGIVLDESSILKNFTGKLRNLIIEKFDRTPYKLACTATPSPNNELEIGNHAEFLSVMKSSEMRALYFTTDKNIISQNKFRLKSHARKNFYQWIGTWATVLTTPHDIGFDGQGYLLPNLNLFDYCIKTKKKEDGKLFNDTAVSATNFNQELRETIEQRLTKAAEIAKNTEGPVIIWIKQNIEGEFLKKILPEAVEVKGSDNINYKEKKLLGFAKNEFRILITKAKIAQYGLNYQNCNNQIFASLDFSFEGLYQAIRRSYRFGQTKEVNIHLITTDTMQNVIKSINTKQEKFNKMIKGIVDEVNKKESIEINRSIQKEELDECTLYLGDSVQVMDKEIIDNSIDYSFFSPPFSSMYVFSDRIEDLSNVPNDYMFFKHFNFVIEQLYRITKPGRLVSIHMMQGTTLKGRDGFYSIKDHRGEYIRAFQKAGFYFHAEVMIRKDPKTAAIRTKNHQLMHGTTKKDSSNNRPGLADYILTFRKQGQNEEPIKNDIPFDLWCKMAEPVWIDVDESDVLDYKPGKDQKDERHITATQLKPIERCIMLWSNKGDTVLSPFAGIGSELYQAIIMDRKAIGIELKESYFELAKKNVASAVASKAQTALF